MVAAKAELKVHHNHHAASQDVSSQPVPFASPALGANKMSKLEKFRLEKRLNDSSRHNKSSQNQPLELSQVEVSIPVID